MTATEQNRPRVAAQHIRAIVARLRALPASADRRREDLYKELVGVAEGLEGRADPDEVR